MNIFRSIVLGAVMIAAPMSMANAAGSGDGYSRNITVYNNSDYRVYRIYYGVPGMEYYSRDLLSDYVLNADYHIRLNVDNGRGDCVYNLRAVTESGDTYWERTLNVCRERSWTLTN